MTTHDAPTVEDLKTLLQSDDLGDRLRAVNQARPLPVEHVFEILMQAAQDANSRVRYAAISQLGTLKLPDPSQALPLLRQALAEDLEPDVRAAAAAALGDLKQLEAFEDLAAAYRRETEWLVQFSLVAAMGELGNPLAYDYLMEALAQDNDLIRTAAAAALGDLGDPRAIPALEAYIGSDDWQLRYRVALALAQIGGDAARPGLARLAQDDVEQVAAHATQALESLT